jgi:hypothetical protein
MNAGTILLLDRFGALCRELGLAPSQSWALFDALPYGSRRAAWSDLARYAATRGSAS